MMTNRGNNGQSGNSAQGWSKSKDRLGQLESSKQHWWYAA